MDLRKIERVYSAYSSVYDQTFGRIFHKSLQRVIQNLEIEEGDRILEIGVGTGISLPLYPATSKVVGIDLSPGMLKRARRRLSTHQFSHIELMQMDAGHMEFEDDSFDLVIAAYVVTAVPDYRKLVTEMIRVCRPGGRIMMLNHFSNGGLLMKVISPFFELMGFRTDLSLNHILAGTSLMVACSKKVRFWDLVECVNNKSGSPNEDVVVAPQNRNPHGTPTPR